MSDDYPRVLPRLADSGPALWEDCANGYLKVVPADAIVIERSELPEVRPDSTVLVPNPGRDGDITYFVDSDEDPMKAALAFLALAEHLEAHPPVDEAQVEALAADIHAVHPSPTLGDEIARHLIRNGWTKEPRP